MNELISLVSDRSSTLGVLLGLIVYITLTVIGSILRLVGQFIELKYHDNVVSKFFNYMTFRWLLFNSAGVLFIFLSWVIFDQSLFFQSFIFAGVVTLAFSLATHRLRIKI